MKTSCAITHAFVALAASLLGVSCASQSSSAIKTITLSLKQPIALEQVGSAADLGPGGLESTPALDEWQAKNHADIVGDPVPVIDRGRLLGWSLRWVPSENPYLWHLAYARTETSFTLTSGASTESVLTRLWRWRSATLGYLGRPIYLNYRATPMTLITHPVPVGDPDLPRGSDNRDLIDLNMLHMNTEHEGRVYGFWYVYHDPSFSVVLDQLHLTLPVGVTSEAEYLAQRKQLEMMAAPAPRVVNGRLVFKDEDLPAAEEPLVMERFVVPSGWLDIQPFARDARGPVAMVKIRGVTAGTPIYKAGIREGEILRSFQGVTLAGLSEDELNRLMKQPLTSDLRLELMTTPRSRPREVLIPLVQLREALASKADSSAGKPAR